LGAPQTCDQVKIYGSHVRHFQQMPLPGARPKEIAFARQMALVAFTKAVGSEVGTTDEGRAWYGCISNAGPVHLNFPFEEPLKPNMQAEGLFAYGRNAFVAHRNYGYLSANSKPSAETIEAVFRLMDGKRTLVCCGEGSFTNSEEAAKLLDWARAYQLPLFADPLSNLRCIPDPLVIDNYDKIVGDPDFDDLDFEVVIRFGRYPVSKFCTSKIAENDHIQIVVDTFETRDFNATTDFFVPTTPAAFVETFLQHAIAPQEEALHIQKEYAEAWIIRNDAEAWRIIESSQVESGFEGTFVHQLMELAPEGSCLFAANSMAIRLVDTFYLKNAKRLDLFCNRGLNGIDGTLSSAIGAAQYYEQTTLLLGDLALIHDMNALALQRELMRNATEDGKDAEKKIPGIVIVVLNNEGGAIFDMLPQKSDEPYFERLFTTPQKIDFSQIASGFAIPFCRVSTSDEFEKEYRSSCGKPGLHLIEITIEPGKLKEYYGDFLS
ncbi:MAG: hypothetical protein LBB35_03835, partial [Coriobacteriaceae bacterium]|nr:hypothetical protein [Coriobacteriaceae bacterium]